MLFLSWKVMDLRWQMPLKLQALKCCHFFFFGFYFPRPIEKNGVSLFLCWNKKEGKKIRTWNWGSVHKEIRLFYYFVAPEVITAKLNTVPSLCCFRYQAWPLEDCLNEAVVQDMKRVRPEDHDSVYGQNRQSFRPPPVLAPAPVGMATYSEQLQQDGLSGLAQFPAAAQMAGAPGYQ